MNDLVTSATCVGLTGDTTEKDGLAQQRRLDATTNAVRMAQEKRPCYRHRMRQDDRQKHWRQLAEGYVESAATLYRKKKYPQMLHHCYFAVQSVLEATFIGRQVDRIPETVSLVVMANALGDGWSVPHRETFLELTHWYRATAGNAEGSVGRSKEECLRLLTVTAELVGELRTGKQ